MAKSVIYKKAKEWVWESLSKNENQSGIELFDKIQCEFPQNELPQHPHTIRAWVRGYHQLSEVKGLNTRLKKFNIVKQITLIEKELNKLKKIINPKNK